MAPDTWNGPLPSGFNLMRFGAAMTVGIALITQMGEQADYLRFMPEPLPGHKARWWAGVVIGGPGWVIPGVLKMLSGTLLAYLAATYRGTAYVAPKSSAGSFASTRALIENSPDARRAAAMI